MILTIKFQNGNWIKFRPKDENTTKVREGETKIFSLDSIFNTVIMVAILINTTDSFLHFFIVGQKVQVKKFRYWILLKFVGMPTLRKHSINIRLLGRKAVERTMNRS
jgi:hypothetical protein